MPVQLVGVVVEVKSTLRGAVPLVGAADAVQEREQTGTAETVTVPVFEQVTPWAVAVIFQLYKAAVV
jgi:hypothetical protein